jgi:hypothetical protein
MQTLRLLVADQIRYGQAHGRFADPVYYLTKPMSWKPRSDQSQKYTSVEVPAGFVFSFDYIPQVFWSLLRPDGEHASAVIIHEYLYWTQTTPRAVADDIFKLVMEEFSVDPKITTTLYQAVRVQGQAAWDQNAKLKASGEKRILKAYPTDGKIRWEEWKKRPDVFSDSSP